MTSSRVISPLKDDQWQQLDDLLRIVFGEAFARLWRDFHGRPPFCRREYCKAIVVDGRLVSHVAFVPRSMRIGSAVIRAGTIGYMATHPDYRGHGFARRLMEDWTQQAMAEGYHLGYINGIPDFYEKFGYSFAFGQDITDAALSIDLEKIPRDDGLDRVRPFQWGDLPHLMKLYDQDNVWRNGTLIRSSEYWEWLLAGLENYGHVGKEDRLVCLSDAGSCTGYLLLNRNDFGRFMIWEIAAADEQSLLALLAKSAQLAHNERVDKIFLRVPLDHPVVLQVLQLGGQLTSYTWGVYGRLFDLAGLFETLRPELSRRVVASSFRNWQGTVFIDTDLGTVILGIRNGQVIGQEVPGPTHQLRMPQSWLVKLVTGYADPGSLIGRRGIDMTPNDWPILRALFPKGNPYIWAADSGY